MKNKIYKDTARESPPSGCSFGVQKLSLLPHGNPEQEDCEEYRKDGVYCEEETEEEQTPYGG